MRELDVKYDIINLGGVPRGCDLFSIILREDGTETSMACCSRGLDLGPKVPC
jgi:hypothetical protein